MSRVATIVSLAVVLVACSGSTSSSGGGGESLACSLYRSHAGDVEAGMMTKDDFISWAQDIENEAAGGSDQTLKTAATALANDAATSSNPEADPNIVSDQKAVLSACSSLGY